MKIKTSELQGAALDWAVAKCDGELNVQDFYLHESTSAFMLEKGEVSYVYSPTTRWAQGGPIIEREKMLLWPITVDVDGNEKWGCRLASLPALIEHTCRGSTPLIAAMRVYVASKLGDEVEVPKEIA